jgi:hypothetical protein
VCRTATERKRKRTKEKMDRVVLGGLLSLFILGGVVVVSGND